MKIREMEELTVKPLGEMEQPRDMDLSSARVAALDLLQMPQDEMQNGEPQAGFAATGVKESGPTNDRNENVTSENAIAAGADLDCHELQIQQCVTSCEEQASEIDSAETEKHSNDVDGQRNDDVAERRDNKESLENSHFRGGESDLQHQDNSQDFTKSFAYDLTSEMANTELQQKPKDSEEGEVESNEVEGASTTSHPQANATSGKKKKKKRKGKKKGRANEDSEKDKNEDDTADKYEGINQLQSNAVDVELVTEVLLEPRTCTDNGKLNPQQIKAEDPEGREKSNEPAVQSKTLEDPKPDESKKKQNENQTSEVAIMVEEESLKTVESFSHIEMPVEVHTEDKTEGKDVNEGVESEKMDKGEIAKINDTFTPETLKEPTIVQVMEEDDEEVNSEVDRSAAAKVEEVEFVAVSHTVASQGIAMECSLALEVQISGTGGAEETAGTTENHSGDRLSEESGMGHPEENRNLGKDSSETETLIILAPLDDPGCPSPTINDFIEVNKHTLNSKNPSELTDMVMIDGGADLSDAQDTTTYIDNESESGKGKAKLEQNLEDELQAASTEAPPVTENSENETSTSDSFTDGLSGLHALSESLRVTQLGANTKIRVSVSQNDEESERESVTAKKEEVGRDESLAGELATNTDLSDPVTSPNLVTEADNTMSQIQDDDKNYDGDGNPATRVHHESEDAKIVDKSEVPGGPTKADHSVKQQSTDGTLEDLSPNLRVSEVDEDEGQSFEFDDLELQVAFSTKIQLEDMKEGGQAPCDHSNNHGSVLDWIDSESKHNAQPEVVGSHAEEAVNPSGQAVFQQTAAMPASEANVAGNPKKVEPEVGEQPVAHK